MATKIYDVNDLQDISLDLAGDYELANDIDAFGFDFAMLAGSFTGSLDGQVYSIIGLTITKSGTGFQSSALFDDNYGTIKNVKLVDCVITVTSTTRGAWAASLALNNWGTIEKCSATGTVSCTGNTSYSAYSMGAGLVVGNLGIGVIKKSHSTADVTVVGNKIEAAGFICMNYGEIDESYGTGDANANGTGNVWAAGFVCENDENGKINDSYARGNSVATTTAGNAYAGGFVAQNYGVEANVITNCYSTGTTTASTTDGGFCAVNAGIITNCFWDIETSGDAASAGGTGKTTPQMKTRSTFTGWNFSTIWSITPFCNNGYPCLQDVTPNCALVPSIYGTQVTEIIALEAMRNLEMACGGRVYVDEEGDLTYESRYARNP